MVTTRVIDVAIGMIVTGALTSMVVCVKSLLAKSKAMSLAVRSLSHDALFRYCRYLMDKETITESEHENLEHLYKSYSLLGMNGTGQQMYEECKKKPIKSTDIKYLMK